MFGTFEVFRREYSAAERPRDPSWRRLQANKRPEAALAVYHYAQTENESEGWAKVSSLND